jgi:hypothetical protein
MSSENPFLNSTKTIIPKSANFLKKNNQQIKRRLRLYQKVIKTLVIIFWRGFAICSNFRLSEEKAYLLPALKKDLQGYISNPNT